MKKTYTKPQISFESFLMSTNIAAGCEFKTSQMAEGACGYKPSDRWTGPNVFVSASTGCGTTYPNGEYSDGKDVICYHNPTDLNNLFNS